MVNPEDVKLYRTPNLRELALDTLTRRLEERRTRRMLAAIEVNQKKQAKLIGMRDKDIEKYAKQMEKAATNLDKALELLNKADDALREATMLHNSAFQLNEALDP